MSIKALDNLHTASTGKQVLLLFKLDKLARFTESHLDGVRKLMARYNRLKPADGEIENTGDQRLTVK